MKILYAIQATGNGHISRAIQLLPYLSSRGEVDTILSGSNSTLSMGIDPTYRSNGVSLFYRKCGGLNYFKMLSRNGVYKAVKDAKDLPVEKYDLVVNDFDFVTAHACRLKKVKSIQFGHQASFMSSNTPRPNQKSQIGELILKYYAQANNYLGLHFEQYDSFIFPPVIKEQILNANPSDKGHITVYLPSYDKDCLEFHFNSLADLHFEVFSNEVDKQIQVGNITYFPISNEGFTESLIHCHGIITGGGFETPSEALYLNKKLMCIPIRNHYEQACNAAAVKLLGGYVLNDIDDQVWQSQIRDWLDLPKLNYIQKANDINSTLDFLIDMADFLH